MRNIQAKHLKLAEKICLKCNRHFRPPPDMQMLKDDPSPLNRYRYSLISSEKQLPRILKFLNYSTLDGMKVLDLGCGYGGLVAAIAEKYHCRIHGLDFNFSILGLAKQNISGDFYIVGNAESLPFESNQFDLVITVATMEHFSSPGAVLNECARVLRPGGELFIRFSSFYAPNGAHLYDFINIPWCHLLFSRKTLFRVWQRLAENNQALAGLNDTVNPNVGCLQGLNRISVRRFKRLLAETNLKVLRYEENTFRKPFFWIMQKIPLLRELLTIEIVVVLKKTE